ncbi:hypothetical protein [Micromonospora sp. NPDC051006]|uniref:hypothetical protein n=1 Tax=Micromonospora sp. NPDC051006 TaxID=3364283 RepID=UPI00379D5095
MDVRGRWWNGVWGRLARRDVWLTREIRWRVVARAGDSETGRILRWEFDTEAEARAMVARLLRGGSGRWREQTVDAAAAPPPAAQAAGRGSEPVSNRQAIDEGGGNP